MNTIAGSEIGTTSTKVLIMRDREILAIVSSDPYEPDHPFAGASRQNPKVWWNAYKQALARACKEAGINPSDIDCIVIGGQMHGLVPDNMDEASLWNDSTAEKHNFAADMALGETPGIDILKTTGNCLSPNFTLMKLVQMMTEHQPLFDKMKSFTLPAGHVTRMLTGDAFIDSSDASGTQLWDIQNRTWSEDIFTRFKIPTSIRPRLVESLEIASKVERPGNTGLRKGIPVLAGGADQAESALGMGVIPANAGRVSFTMGTSGVITASMLKPDPDERLNTFAGAKGVITFLCTNACGDSQTFIMKLLGIDTYPGLDRVAAVSPIGSNGVLYIPLLSGSRLLNNYNPNGGFLGMGLGTTRNDLARAVQEGIVMEALLGLNVIMSKVNVRTLWLGGGGANSSFLAQMVADICNLPVSVPEVIETTVLGSTIRAAVAMKEFSSIEEACKALVVAKPRKFRPKNHAAYEPVIKRFEKAIKMVASLKS